MSRASKLYLRPIGRGREVVMQPPPPAPALFRCRACGRSHDLNTPATWCITSAERWAAFWLALATTLVLGAALIALVVYR